jgi:hypothetical protein
MWLPGRHCGASMAASGYDTSVEVAAPEVFRPDSTPGVVEAVSRVPSQPAPESLSGYAVSVPLLEGSSQLVPHFPQTDTISRASSESRGTADGSGCSLDGQFQDTLNGLSDEKIHEEIHVFERLVRLSRSFEQSAVHFGRTIISEKHLPNNRKTVTPKELPGVAGGTKFLLHSILFRFAVADDGSSRRTLYESDESAAKEASHQLRSLVQFTRANHEVAGSPAHRLVRTPQMLLVDWLGYRLLAVSRVPISGDGTLVYGSAEGGARVVDRDYEAAKAIRAVCARLGLAPHVTCALSERGDPRECAERCPLCRPSSAWGALPRMAPGPVCPSAHAAGVKAPISVASSRAHLSGEPQCSVMFGPCDMEVHRSPLDNSLYALDFARLFPPEPPKGAAGRPPMLGPTKRSDVFTRLLRPELVQWWAATRRQPLSSDAFLKFQWHGVTEHASRVTQAKKYLDTTIVPAVASFLCSRCGTRRREADAEGLPPVTLEWGCPSVVNAPAIAVRESDPLTSGHFPERPVSDDTALLESLLEPTDSIVPAVSKSPSSAWGRRTVGEQSDPSSVSFFPKPAREVVDLSQANPTEGLYRPEPEVLLCGCSLCPPGFVSTGWRNVTADSFASSMERLLEKVKGTGGDGKLGGVTSGRMAGLPLPVPLDIAMEMKLASQEGREVPDPWAQYDPDSMCRLFHSQGMNLRGMGLLWRYLSCDVWRLRVGLEMFARSFRARLQLRWRRLSELRSRESDLVGDHELWREEACVALNDILGTGSRSSLAWVCLIRSVCRKFPGIAGSGMIGAQLVQVCSAPLGMVEEQLGLSHSEQEMEEEEFSTSTNLLGEETSVTPAPVVPDRLVRPWGAYSLTIPQFEEAAPEASLPHPSEWLSQLRALRELIPPDALLFRVRNLCGLVFSEDLEEAVKAQGARFFMSPQPLSESDLINLLPRIKTTPLLHYAEGTVEFIRALHRKQELLRQNDEEIMGDDEGASSDAGMEDTHGDAVQLGFPQSVPGAGLPPSVLRSGQLALQSLARALAIGGDDGATLSNLGYLLESVMDAPRLAAKVYLHATEATSGHARSHYYLAMALRRAFNRLHRIKGMRESSEPFRLAERWELEQATRLDKWLTNAKKDLGNHIRLLSYSDPAAKARAMIQSEEIFREIVERIDPGHVMSWLNRGQNFSALLFMGSHGSRSRGGHRASGMSEVAAATSTAREGRRKDQRGREEGSISDGPLFEFLHSPKGETEDLRGDSRLWPLASFLRALEAAECKSSRRLLPHAAHSLVRYIRNNITRLPSIGEALLPDHDRFGLDQESAARLILDAIVWRALGSFTGAVQSALQQEGRDNSLSKFFQFKPTRGSAIGYGSVAERNAAYADLRSRKHKPVAGSGQGVAQDMADEAMQVVFTSSGEFVSLASESSPLEGMYWDISARAGPTVLRSSPVLSMGEDTQSTAISLMERLDSTGEPSVREQLRIKPVRLATRTLDQALDMAQAAMAICNDDPYVLQAFYCLMNERDSSKARELLHAQIHEYKLADLELRLRPLATILRRAAEDFTLLDAVPKTTSDEKPSQRISASDVTMSCDRLGRVRGEGPDWVSRFCATFQETSVETDLKPQALARVSQLFMILSDLHVCELGLRNALAKPAWSARNTRRFLQRLPSLKATVAASDEKKSATVRRLVMCSVRAWFLMPSPTTRKHLERALACCGVDFRGILSPAPTPTPE